MTVYDRSPTPFARVLGALVALGALLAGMLLAASPAQAHARLEATSPKDGATLPATPPEVMLRFNEPLKDGLNQVTVKSGSSDVATGSPEVEGNSVYQPISSSMKAGRYTVTYKVVSADGHPVSGSFSFTYSPPGEDDGAGSDPKATPSSPSKSSAPAGTSSPSSSSPSSSEETSEAEQSPTSEGDSSTSPSSTTSPTESSTTSPAETSETTTTSPTSDTAQEEQTAGGDGISPWWWVAGGAALAVLVGAVALLARGRRGPGDDEDVTFEEWRE